MDGFKLGMKKAVPIGLGYFPLGMAFGVIAQSAGLTVGQVGLMSLLIFSGSGQYIAVGLLAMGAGFWSLVATVLLVNSRYLLFGAAISRYVSQLSPWTAALVCQGLTDETFVVATAHFQEHAVQKGYWLGLNLTSHAVWISSGLLGAAVGNFLPDLDSLGLNFALPAMFIALFFMTTGSRRGLAVGAFAGLVSLALYTNGFATSNVIIATVVAATAGVMMQKWILD